MTASRDEDSLLQDNETQYVEDPGWPGGFIAVLALAGIYLIWRITDLVIRFLRWMF